VNRNYRLTDPCKPAGIYSVIFPSINWVLWNRSSQEHPNDYQRCWQMDANLSPHTAEHPRSTRRRNIPCGNEDASVNPGAKINEPETGITPPEDPIPPKGRLGPIEGHYSEYTKEYRLALVHRLYLRGLPLGQIGAMLGITIRQVQSIRTELFERLRDEAEHADIMLIVGETLAFYDTIRNMSMKIASESTDASEKLEAMRTALSAEADKHRFLQAFGFYDNAKYVPQTSTEDDEA
jgi:hypothetical protein